MPCPWDPDEPSIEEELETGLIDLTRYLRKDRMTPYRDRLNNGEYVDKPKKDEAKSESKSTAKDETKSK
jgi:hypothetical protein